MKKLFYRLFPPSRHPEEKRPYTNKAIKKGFKIGDVQYYEFKNPLDVPWQRYLQLQQFIDEANTRISNKDLGEYIDMQLEAINTGNLSQVAVIANDIKRRIDMIVNVELMYKIFACVFFNIEDGEDLTNYDYDFNEGKIEIFKHEDIGSFFLQEPMSRFLPQLDFSKQDLTTLLKMSQAEEKKQQKQTRIERSNRPNKG